MILKFRENFSYLLREKYDVNNYIQMTIIQVSYVKLVYIVLE